MKQIIIIFLLSFFIIALSSPSYAIMKKVEVSWNVNQDTRVIGYNVYKGIRKVGTIMKPNFSWSGVLSISKSKYAPSEISVDCFTDKGIKSEKEIYRFYYDYKTNKIIGIK